MFEVSVKTHFSGAHRLEGYDGPCSRMHGHNWDVEVFLRGTGLDANGMLVDFSVVKAAVQNILEDMDHRNLNENPAFVSVNPTSENICVHIFEKLSDALDCDRFSVSKVKVSETGSTSATYRRD